MHDWGNKDSTREVTDDLPVAVLREVPKLVDMQSVQPRLQAIDGPLDQAALRGKL